MPEELHLYAKNAGAMVGPITLVDSGDTIDCSRMGSGGYSIPSIVEEEIVQFKKNSAKFVLHVEKDTVWRRFNEDKFWRLHNCILRSEERRVGKELRANQAPSQTRKNRMR